MAVHAARRTPHAALLSYGLLLLGASPAHASALRLASVESACALTKLFERCELTVHVDGQAANPYNPDEVSLEATFTSPQGHPVTVYGFYYQPFERMKDGNRDVLQESGPPVWKVRFTPRQIGRWSYAVQLVTHSGTQSFTGEPFLVVTSSRKGFVRLDRDAGMFRFDAGDPFIPIGENLSWGPSVQPLRAYDQWFHDLSRQRANYIRVWMAPWMFRLETKETGVGRYDQARAWALDYLLEQSESAGLFWQLCLLNHGSFSRTQDPDWQNNPYSEALGGMCRLPNDFLIDPRARAMFQRLLRYMVNRWGSSPQLAVWELFNEADFGEFRTDDLATWINVTGTFLRSIDVNQRAITTSFHRQGPDAVWRSPAIDVIQLHVYDRRDFAAAFTGPEIPKLQQTFQKPVFIGEFGWIDEVMRTFDDIGIHLHDGLWSSLIGGGAGGALSWYWDSYVHPNHLERHFRAAEMFWRGERLGRATRRLDLSLSNPTLAGWGIGTPERGYLWIKNRTHTLDGYIAYRCALAKERLRAARGQVPEPVTYSAQPVRGATATVRGLDWMGRYRVEWWNPYRGRIEARSVTPSRGGTVTIEVPEVGFDVAGKLIKLQWWERG